MHPAWRFVARGEGGHGHGHTYKYKNVRRPVWVLGISILPCIGHRKFLYHVCTGLVVDRPDDRGRNRVSRIISQLLLLLLLSCLLFPPLLSCRGEVLTSMCVWASTTPRYRFNNEKMTFSAGTR